jgi:hypothetical protein
VEQWPPRKFMGPEFAKRLGLPGEVADRSFLVLRKGTKEATVSYPATNAVPIRRNIYLIMLDTNDKPVASEEIGITVPEGR